MSKQRHEASSMRDGKAVYATVLFLLGMSVSYLFVLVVKMPIAIPRLLLAISGLMVLVATLLLYKSKGYRLLWLAALVFYGSIGWLGYDLVFGGDTELLIWGTAALLLGVLGGGLALARKKPVV